MRRIVVTGLSMVALAAGAVGAKAQMQDGGSDPSASLRSVASAPGSAGAPSFGLRSGDPGESRGPGRSVVGRPTSVMTAEALGPGESGSVPIASAALAAPVKKSAEPWCRSGRIAGSGAGFCLIN